MINAHHLRGRGFEHGTRLEGPPLVVESTFKCPICKTRFTARHGLYRENQVGYQSDDVIPMGVVPVHEKKMQKVSITRFAI